MTAADARTLSVDAPVQWTRQKNGEPLTCFGRVTYVGRMYFIVTWHKGDYRESTYWHTTGPDYACLERTPPP